MKMQEAMKIIEEAVPKIEGYMVAFEHQRGAALIGDHFPEKNAGEPLIPTEEEAWELAHRFAAATKERCVNIYVVNSNYRPVLGYNEKRLSGTRGNDTQLDKQPEA